MVKTNAELEKFNEDVVKFQSKVKIAFRHQNESTGRNEVGMMRVNNWREPVSSEVDLTQAIDGNTSALGHNKSVNMSVGSAKQPSLTAAQQQQ